MKMIPLGIIVTDSATGLRGMLTHMQIEQDGSRYYCFQPTGLHAETGQPLKSQWLKRERIKKIPDEVEDEMPIEILGTQVTDDASGFTGMATAITKHVSGCVHVLIQPRGRSQNGTLIEPEDFDLRRCSGKAIPAITIPQRAKAEKARPSPIPMQPYRPR